MDAHDDLDPAESERRLIEETGRRSGVVGIRQVDDLDLLQELLTATVAGVRREVCSALPAGPYSLSMLRSSWRSDAELMRRGVNGLALYQSDAARRPETLHYLSEFVAQGARVRIAPRVTHRTIIFDRQTVFVGTEEDVLGAPMLLVTEPVLVKNFYAQFAVSWRSAHSVGLGAEDTLGDESVREILQILSSGVTDDVAARQLGISARTVRRRVAAVLDLLGASSRFEAGAKAVQAGWI